jgi:hypothetical protein
VGLCIAAVRLSISNWTYASRAQAFGSRTLPSQVPRNLIAHRRCPALDGSLPWTLRSCARATAAMRR